MSTSASAVLTMNDVAMRASDDLSFRLFLRHSPREAVSTLNIDEPARNALITRDLYEVRRLFKSLASEVVFTVTAVWINTNTVVVLVP